MVGLAAPARRLPAALATGCTVLFCGCGSAALAPEAGTQQPVAAAHLVLRTSGSPVVDVDASTLTVRADEAGILAVTATAVSRAATRSTVTMTATLHDAAGALVGHATGGAVGVDPGVPVAVTLNGPLPTGVVASVDLVVALQPAPTPHP